MTVRREDTKILRMDPAPQPSLPVKTAGSVRSKFRVVVWSGIWLVLGVTILLYGGALVQANIARVETDSAFVGGIIEPVQAPTTGLISTHNAEPGMQVSAGDKLFAVQDPTLEQLIGLASVEVEHAREDLRQKQAVHQAELARRDDWVRSARADVARLDESIKSLEQIEQNARKRVDALKVLYAKGLTAFPMLADATDKLATATSNLGQARIQHRNQSELIEAALAGRGVAGGQVIVRLPETESAAKFAESAVNLAVEKLRVLMQRRADYAVTAGASGRIVRVMRRSGSNVRVGDTVALLERNAERLLYAFVTQSDVVHIALGDKAQVFFPAQNLTATATVAAVDRAGGFLDDVETRYTWKTARDPLIRHTDRDKTARITLQFSAEDQPKAKQILDLGTPAIVSFKRRWADGMLATFEPLTKGGEHDLRVVDRDGDAHSPQMDAHPHIRHRRLCCLRDRRAAVGTEHDLG